VTIVKGDLLQNSKKCARLSLLADAFYSRFLACPLVDDWGRFRWSAMALLDGLYRQRLGSRNDVEIPDEDWLVARLGELEDVGLVHFWECDGDVFGELAGFQGTEPARRRFHRAPEPAWSGHEHAGRCARSGQKFDSYKSHESYDLRLRNESGTVPAPVRHASGNVPPTPSLRHSVTSSLRHFATPSLRHSVAGSEAPGGATGEELEELAANGPQDGSGTQRDTAGHGWKETLRLACNAWHDVMQATAPEGRIAKALRPLTENHDLEAVWRFYLSKEKPALANPQSFAQKFGMWRDAWKTTQKRAVPALPDPTRAAEAAQTWDGLLKDLDVSRNSHATWLKPCRGHAIVDGALIVVVPDERFHEWITKTYLHRLRMALNLSKVEGAPTSIELVNDPERASH